MMRLLINDTEDLENLVRAGEGCYGVNITVVILFKTEVDRNELIDCSKPCIDFCDYSIEFAKTIAVK